jgi:hypothetical protein
MQEGDFRIDDHQRFCEGRLHQSDQAISTERLRKDAPLFQLACIVRNYFCQQAAKYL